MRAIIVNILNWPRSLKLLLVVSLDSLLCFISAWLAFYLRLGVFVPHDGGLLFVVFASVIFLIPILGFTGLYREIFRHSGFEAMVSLVWAMVLYTLFFSVIFTFCAIDGVPRTIGLIQPMLLMFFVGGVRAAARSFLGNRHRIKLRDGVLQHALIYGAGDAGRQLASAMLCIREINIVGFLDNDERLHGRLLNGLPIFNPDCVGKIIKNHSITDVLLALPSVSRMRRNEIINSLKHYKVAVRTLPGLGDLVTGKVRVSDLRDLDIDELLGREPVKPNDLLLNLNTRGKTVLVTGAGGSIGSELCRQILKTQPRKLLLLEMCELALYQIHQEVERILVNEYSVEDQELGNGEQNRQSKLGLGIRQAAGVEIIPLLASVCDEARINKIMSVWKPDTVYHAAAYKHVPMVEHNPIEGVRNNVHGTRVIAEASVRYSVRNFVLISTDKAVRPTNIMGATKRLAEMVLQALSDCEPIGLPKDGDPSGVRTVFSMVRFGNVLGSSGSVVPMFREQVKNGGPVTVTHPEITRYFMTIPEAAQLVIQAGSMGQGGDVFVLDMGQPVKIIDLARRLVELSGLTVRDSIHPDGDIEIVVTGLRHGEKLFEELLISDNAQATAHQRIMKAHEEHLGWAELEKILDSLHAATISNDVVIIRELLKKTVSGYQPSSDIVDWVYRAQMDV